VSLLRFALPPSLGTERLVERTNALRDVLSDLLATPVDVTLSQTYEALARNLLSGAVDAAHAPPFVCAQVEPMGATVVARAVRHGRATYGSALVRLKGSGVSLSKPKSIRAAWVDRRSVAGYLLPVAHLKNSRRIETERHFAEQNFYGSYPAALQALIDGKADLAAVHAHKDNLDTVREALHFHSQGREDQFELVELTAEVPSDGVIVRKGGEAEGLKRAFLHLHKEKACKPLLDEIFAAERFDPAPPMAYRVLYAVAPRDM
jgi:phosphonate transport system substrate-binding protein